MFFGFQIGFPLPADQGPLPESPDELAHMLSTIRTMNPDAHAHLMARFYVMARQTYDHFEPLRIEAAKNKIFQNPLGR